MKRMSKIKCLHQIGLTQLMILCSLQAYCQPVGELVLSSDDSLTQNQKSNDEPKIEFYNWLYGSSRRNWYEWHTVTASVNSSIVETGFRVRGMGAVGAYGNNIKGDKSENIVASANALDDYILPSMGTVGKLYAMQGFGGLQIGYTYAVDNYKISGFIGGSRVSQWPIASNMTTQVIKFSTDLATQKKTKYGVLASLEMEYHPNDQLIFSTWGVYTPAYKWGYFEIRSGVALPFRELISRSFLGSAYIGPHVALSVSDGTKQPMFGAHLSEVTLGPVHMSITTGYTYEPFLGNGIYSIMESSVQF